MKVVILCGGLGTRIRDVTDAIPKPMVPIGPYPIVWHIMKYYAHFGFDEFVLCLGYKKQSFIDFFLNYRTHTSDFTVKLGPAPSITHHEASAGERWTVTLADTGLETATGSRLKRITPYLTGETFLLTYGDGLSNVDIRAVLAHHARTQGLVTICGVHPYSRFGELKLDGHQVTSFAEKPQTTQGYVNGGFMVLQREFVDRYVDHDTHCTLEADALPRAVRDGRVNAFCHDGFWQCMDTAREHKLLNDLWTRGAPWKVW